ADASGGSDAAAGRVGTGGGSSGTNDGAGGGLRAAGQACATAGDCASGFCVDAVCCSNACFSGCQTCSAVGSVGTCTNRGVGTSPRAAVDCAAAAPASCGFDGTCDGVGACRRYLGGTVCGAGTCQGQSVVGQAVCDGLG